MRPTSAFPTRGWGLVLLGAAALLGLSAAPPLVGGDAAAWIRAAFSPLCHQIPERTPHLHGEALALCHRDMGLLLGLVLGLLATPALPRRLLARSVAWPPVAAMALAGLPLAVDWTLGAAGLWANTPASRLLTGLLLGLAAGWLLTLSLAPRLATGVPSSTPNLLST
jgi:uncharacterized membrane protein